jgi:hypothetical protein
LGSGQRSREPSGSEGVVASARRSLLAGAVMAVVTARPAWTAPETTADEEGTPFTVSLRLLRDMSLLLPIEQRSPSKTREGQECPTVLVNELAHLGKEMFKVLGNLPADPRPAGTAVQSESLGERTRLVTPNRTCTTARAPGRVRSYGWCDAVKARHVKVGLKEAATCTTHSQRDVAPDKPVELHQGRARLEHSHRTCDPTARLGVSGPTEPRPCPPSVQVSLMLKTGADVDALRQVLRCAEMAVPAITFTTAPTTNSEHVTCPRQHRRASGVLNDSAGATGAVLPQGLWPAGHCSQVSASAQLCAQTRDNVSPLPFYRPVNGETSDAGQVGEFRGAVVPAVEESYQVRFLPVVRP